MVIRLGFMSSLEVRGEWREKRERKKARQKEEIDFQRQ